MRATTVKRFAKRADELRKVFGIVIENLDIFQTRSALGPIEYVMHEIAHGLTMGFEQLPKNLATCVSDTLCKYSEVTQDHLEIDTAYVTFKAMVILQLAKPEDQPLFAARCSASCITLRYNERLYVVMNEFEVRELEGTALNDTISALCSIMRAPLREVLATYLLPDAKPDRLLDPDDPSSYEVPL